MTQFRFDHDSRVWLTSDTHFGHSNIIKYCNRPWADAGEMNEALISNWNSVVAPGDTVIHLGDVAMGKIAETLPLVTRLNGRKHLIVGNHDRCYRDAGKTREYEKYFETVDREGTLEVRGVRFLLSHFPYQGVPDHGHRSAKEALEIKSPTDLGVPLLCGHVHDTFADARSALGTPMLNVGVDVRDYRPISLSAVLHHFQF